MAIVSLYPKTKTFDIPLLLRGVLTRYSKYRRSAGLVFDVKSLQRIRHLTSLKRSEQPERASTNGLDQSGAENQP